MTRTYGAGTITYRGDGRYQLRWSEGRDPMTGKYIRKSLTINARNLTAARRELNAITARARRNVRQVTVRELLDAAIPALPKATERTKVTYGHALKHLPDSVLNLKAVDITHLKAGQIIEGLCDLCPAPTVKKIHTALMAAWRYAANHGWVDVNPWKGQYLPEQPGSAGKVITDDEVRALRAACDPIERVWLDLHLATGARPGEVLGLRWSDVDLDELVVTFIDAKHGGKPRAVAITPELGDTIRQWHDTQSRRAWDSCEWVDPDPFVISSVSDSSVPWRVAYAGQYRWPRLRERAGVRAELRLYDTRHTHNSWLSADGYDAATRAARIGNSPVTNLRTYSHSTRDREAAAAAWKRME
jgi:integrase